MKNDELIELEFTKRWAINQPNVPAEVRDEILPLINRSLELLTGAPDVPVDTPQPPTRPAPDSPILTGKVALLVGHNSVSPGAWVVGNSLSESEYAFHNKVADLMIGRGLGSVEFKRFNRTKGGGYTSEINRVYSQIDKFAPDLTIDMHFNGGGGNYSMVMYLAGSKPSKAVADAMAAVFSDALGIQDSRNAGDSDSIVELTSGENGYYSMKRARSTSVLLEPFFGDNKTHARRVEELGHSGYADLCLTAVSAGLSALRSNG
jgi:hypothetical protein